MTVWYKQGVCGDLAGITQKCLGRIAGVYNARGRDIFVTAVRDGNHSPGSFHYIGAAFDLRKEGVPLKAVRDAAGIGFDVVEHETHYHIEHDPK